MADSTNIINTHENDVIFNIDSLREFIKLIKRQGTENIDFYAVSELLQPPGPNITVTVPEGSRDGNLEPWIDLYNDVKRQYHEANLLDFFDMAAQVGVKRKVFQYIPTIYERNYITDDNGAIIGIRSGYHVYQESSLREVTKKSDILTRYTLKREYDVDNETWISYPTAEQGNTPNYTQDDFDTIFPIPLISTRYTKEDQYPMWYYENLTSLLSDLSNKNNIILDNNKILYLTVPIKPTGDEPQLFFVIDVGQKDKMIQVLSAYLSYNKQINIRKDENIIKTYIKRPINNPDNLPWWKFIYTKYNGNMIYEDGNGESQYYTEFVEDELKENPGKIVVVRKIHPWQDNITNSDNEYDINIKSGRHLYIQAGSLLKFNPGQSTEDKDLIDDYWTNTTPGTFSIDENDGQKAHIITIRGFDQNGDFNNKNPVIGYIRTQDIPSNSNQNGAYKIGSNNYDLTPEQLSQLKWPAEGEYNIPVLLNNNDANITSYEGNFDVMNADQGNFNSITVGGGDGIQFGDDILITSSNEAIRYINNNSATDPAQGLGANNAFVAGSIATYGGISARKTIKGYKIYAAVFNDYAECRKTINLKPGKVVIDNDDGSLSCATKRLQPGAQVISDTYGHLIGEMPGYETPLAVSGRVLVYTYQPRENYHAGMAVCSAPNGTVDIMAREEIKEYPDCIIGIVSEIPNYEKWGSDQVNVDNRIWIKLK